MRKNEAAAVKNRKCTVMSARPKFLTGDKSTSMASTMTSLN